MANQQRFAERLKQCAVDRVALRIVFGVPLHAERKRRRVGNADRLDGTILGDAFDDDTLAWFENALTMQRIDANGFATKQTRKHAILDQPDIVAVSV